MEGVLRFAGSIAAVCLIPYNSGTAQDLANMPVYPEIGRMSIRSLCGL